MDNHIEADKEKFFFKNNKELLSIISTSIQFKMGGAHFAIYLLHKLENHHKKFSLKGCLPCLLLTKNLVFTLYLFTTCKEHTSNVY